MSLSGNPHLLPAPEERQSNLRLSAFLICSDTGIATEMRRQCENIPGLDVIRTFESYPTQDRLACLLHLDTPNTVVIDVANLDAAAGLISMLRLEAPGLQILATDRSCDSSVLLYVMRFGITEFLAHPLSPAAVKEAFLRTRARLSCQEPTIASTDRTYSFLPARAGVGATTTAMNTALALGNCTDQPVFLGDFDLHCGLIRFMLKLQNRVSTLDAVERISELDDNLWRQIVNRAVNIDAVHSGLPRALARLDPEKTRQYIAFLRRKYKFVFADLSGQLEDHAIEIMKVSKQIFLVTMPEMTALHQAREKVRILEDLGLVEQTTLLLNRTPRFPVLMKDEIESMVGLPARVSFSEDAPKVQSALKDGTAVAANCELGKQYQRFAKSLLGATAVVEKKRRFIEYFCTVPGKYRFEHA